MGSAASIVRARQRFYKYGSDYFNHVVLPLSRQLIDELEISHADAGQIFNAFIKMDTDGSGVINQQEFHRFFGWKRSVFTERLFDTYSKSEDGLSYEEFLMLVWTYCSYDQQMMATYLFNIFDLDGLKSLALDEFDAMLRMIYYNHQHDDSCGNNAMATLREASGGASTLSLETFVELVIADNSVIQPAFDIQSRIIEKTTGDAKTADGKSRWELYRERRLSSTEISSKICDGRSIPSFWTLHESYRVLCADKSRKLTSQFVACEMP